MEENTGVVVNVAGTYLAWEYLLIHGPGKKIDIININTNIRRVWCIARPIIAFFILSK